MRNEKSRKLNLRLRDGTWMIIAGLVLCLWIMGLTQGRAQTQSTGDDEIVFLENIPYRKGASKSWLLNLAMPKVVPGAKPRPAIVFIHGGGWREGSYTDENTECREWAKRGYVCLAVGYRLSGEAPFPAAVEDCKCAVRWLRAHAKEYHVDPYHIWVMGHSAGGHLALMLGLTTIEADLEGDGPHMDQPSGVQAVMSDCGPMDLEIFYRVFWSGPQLVNQFLPGSKETLAQRMKKASPVTYVRRRSPPILIFQGGDDNAISPEEGDSFVVKMREAGVTDLTYIRLANEGHCFYLNRQNCPWVVQVAENFFRRTLTPESPK